MRYPAVFRSYETVIPKEPPIVQEITSVLREWGSIWKNLYIVSEKESQLKLGCYDECLHYLNFDLQARLEVTFDTF